MASDLRAHTEFGKRIYPKKQEFGKSIMKWNIGQVLLRGVWEDSFVLQTLRPTLENAAQPV